MSSTTTGNEVTRFSGFARVLHWVMAAAILAMLFVGIFMVTSVGQSYIRLVDLHRPLGIAILLLAIVRLVNRFVVRPPPLPDDIGAIGKFGAHASHIALYGLMIAMPLIGWGMLSAGDYPVVMWQGFTLPHILPHDLALFATLRELHTIFALLLFFTVLAHLAAALLHALILRDGVWPAMASLRAGRKGLTRGRKRLQATGSST